MPVTRKTRLRSGTAGSVPDRRRNYARHYWAFAAPGTVVVLAVIVFPYFFAVPLAVLPAGAADWLLRVTPAAGFAIQQAYPRYPQVAAAFTPGNGYYPLSPWGGFMVLCAYAAIALSTAAFLQKRRDA